MMNYKKPAFWMIVSAVLICFVVVVLLLAGPKGDGQEAAVPPASGEPADTAGSSTEDPSQPDAREEDGAEVSPLLSITGEQIGTAAVYKDEAGRLTKKVETWNSGIVKETSYSYYPDGNKKEVTVYNGEVLMRTKYREDGTMEIVHEETERYIADSTFTETGSRSSLALEYPDGSRKEETYDSKNRRISLVRIDKNQIRVTDTYTYYEDGRVKTHIVDDERHGTYSESYNNEDGSWYCITESRESKAFPDLVSSQVRLETFIDAEGNKTTKTEYIDGRIEERRDDADSKPVWSKVTKPDGTTEEKYYTDGKLSRHIVNGEEMPIAGS